jgi:hypothetical protein
MIAETKSNLVGKAASCMEMHKPLFNSMEDVTDVVLGVFVSAIVSFYKRALSYAAPLFTANIAEQ